MFQTDVSCSDSTMVNALHRIESLLSRFVMKGSKKSLVERLMRPVALIICTSVVAIVLTIPAPTGEPFLWNWNLILSAGPVCLTPLNSADRTKSLVEAPV